MFLELVSGKSYTSQLVQSFMNGLLSEKESRAWRKRKDGLLEDITGNVFTIDLKVTGNEVKVYLKQIQILNF